MTRIYVSAGALVTATLLGLMFCNSTLEDAQITYRYALRLSEGYPIGMWNRTGAPVEGYTTMLWMLVLSLSGPSLASIDVTAKAIGIASHSATVAVLLYLPARLRSAKCEHANQVLDRDAMAYASAWAGLAIAVSLPHAWYSATGMETSTFIFLATVSVLAPIANLPTATWGLVLAALVLIRPEGLLLATASALYGARMSLPSKKTGGLLAVVTVTAILLYSWRLSYFGHLMPNTYYAKSGEGAWPRHTWLGIQYFGKFTLQYAWLFLALAALFVRHRNRGLARLEYPLAVIIGVAMYFIAIAKSGGDCITAFPFFRQGIILMPLILSCSLYLVGLERNNRIKATVGPALVLFTFALPLIGPTIHNQSGILRQAIAQAILYPDAGNAPGGINPCYIWLRDRVASNAVIATSLAGELPLTVDANHIDMLGLNDEVIAHSGEFDPDGPLDSKTDLDYVFRRAPDVIEGYLNVDIAKGTWRRESRTTIRPKMLRDL